MKKKLYKVTCLILVGISGLVNAEILWAQASYLISGTVSDEAAMPLIGATVLIKGTSTGTITDVDGAFKISANEGATLIASFLGYKTEEIVVKDKKELTITLIENSNVMDEVVVIGYGSVRRGDLTGAVSSVDMESMVKAPVASFDAALAGRVAGVQVTSNDGQPGAESNIVIRGAGSLTQSVRPLYIIDGFAMEDFDPSSLAPQDIESINVLKDASSTAIYGSRGANGVIVISTKMGKMGNPIIAYSMDIGFNRATKRIELMNPYDFVKLQIERYPDIARSVFFDNQPGEMDPEPFRNVKGIDWQDKIMRTGSNQIHSISVSGGNASTKYATSLRYFTQKGTIVNTKYNKLNARIALDQKLSKYATMQLSLLYVNDKASGIVPTDASLSGTATSSLFFSAWGYRPVAGLNPDDNWKLENDILDEEPNINAGSDFRMNPWVMAMNEAKNTENTMTIPNLRLIFKINKNLSVTARGGMDRRMRESDYFYNSKTRLGIQRPGAVYAGVQGGGSYYKYILLSNENVITYTNTFNHIHKIEAQLGSSIQKITTTYNGFKYQEIPYEELGLSGIDKGVPVPDRSVISESRAISAFGRINYDLLSRYLFTLTYRADGSSKFPPKNHWGYFPSGAFAWRASSEPFMNNIQWIDDLKLRFSYGVTGNNRVGDFDYYAQLDTPYSGYYSFNNEIPKIGAQRITLGNKNLKWETTEQTNIGLDWSMLGNRVNLTVDYYNKKTKDLLMRTDIPVSSGFSFAYKNIGSIENRGMEFTLSTVNVKNKTFSWKTDFNISFNKNKVLALSDDEEERFSTVSWDSNFNSTPLYRAKVGGPAAEFWGIEWIGVYQYDDFNYENGKYVLKDNISSNGNPRDKVQPGDIKYKDQDGDLTITDKDRIVIGSPTPKHIGGFGNNFKYKNVSLNVFFQWSYGNDVFNANRLYFEGGYNVRPLQNQFASFVNRWTPENQTNDMPRSGVAGQTGAGPNGIYSSIHIEDGSFLRLKTISIDYQLPISWRKKLQVKNLSVGASAQNIYTWSNYSGFDPEVSVRNSILTPSLDYSSYPRALSMVFNLKITL